VLPGVLVLAIGLTISVAPLTNLVMTAVGEQHAGKASGVNNAAARLASLLAVAVMALIFADRFDAALAAVHASGFAPKGQALAIQAPPAGPAGDAIRQAFEAGYRSVLLLAAGCSFAGGVAAFALIRRSPRRS
jgi:hypothetical protein